MAGKKREEGRELARYMSTYACGPPRELGESRLLWLADNFVRRLLGWPIRPCQGYLWYVRLVLNIERSELHQGIIGGLARRASSSTELLSQEWADAIALEPSETERIWSEALNARMARLAARKARGG